MSAPLPQLRGVDQLTQSAVRDALALVVSDLCAAVADHAEDPSGEFTGELCFPAGRLQSAITAAHVGGVPWRAPWLGPYQWKNWERRSFAELVRHLGSQFGGDLAWQVMLLVGLAFAENEVRAMAPDVFRSELLLWAPEQISALPPSWFLHPAIAAVVRDGFWFPLESRFRVFVRCKFIFVIFLFLIQVFLASMNVCVRRRQM